MRSAAHVSSDSLIHIIACHSITEVWDHRGFQVFNISPDNEDANDVDAQVQAIGGTAAHGLLGIAVQWPKCSFLKHEGVPNIVRSSNG